jgi:hypothetical protein
MADGNLITRAEPRNQRGTQMTKKSKSLKLKGTNFTLDALDGRLNDGDVLDALNEIKNRCFGLQAAVRGARDDFAEEQEGVEWFTGDLAYSIRRLLNAFEAEMQLRSAEKKKAA